MLDKLTRFHEHFHKMKKPNKLTRFFITISKLFVFHLVKFNLTS